MCITTAKPYDSIYIPLKLDKNIMEQADKSLS